MQIAGHNRETDFSKLGTALLVSACVILAVRTAKWPARRAGTNSDRDLETEAEHAIYLASTVLSMLVTRKASMFPGKHVPWYVPSDEDQPR